MATKVEHQFFDGIKYYRYPNAKTLAERRYFKRGKVYLHRAVWEHHYGPIPDGCHIHHRNEDTGDNRIENLELATPKSHAAKHWTPERAARSTAHLQKVRHLAAAWHRSEAGRKWHREHGKKTIKKVARLEYKCERCGKKYTTLKRRTNRYCSNECRSYARYHRGDDNVKRKCPICSKTFMVNRYFKTKTCGRKCGAILRKRRAAK